MSWGVLFGPAVNLFSRLWDRLHKKSQERENAAWSNKFVEAISALDNALPRILIGGQPSNGFVALIPEEGLRRRIEICLIEPQPYYSGHKVKARTLSAEQLSDPMVRGTIQDVLDCVETLRREKPEIAARLHV